MHTPDVEGIPVLRPQLPRTERLLPYLQRIDAARVYTNWGPLACEFEGRLARALSLPEGGVVSASSGTSALVGAILAVAGRASEERPLALIPAFTFVATATAAQECGYIPYLADVDAESWMLNPDDLLRRAALDQVGLVVPVAPFGRPVPQAAWRDFHDRTGIPVVIDGAASFEGLLELPERYLGPIAVALSFHATKSFATGEGGCVALNDIDLGERVTQALNFGIRVGRESQMAHINGKLSEYHAAVGLAELDCWAEKHASLCAVAGAYRERLAGTELAPRLLVAPDISSSYVLMFCRSAVEAERIQNSLRQSKVEFRLWYGRGLHRHGYFSALPHDPLEVTDSIAPRVLRLPLAVDLSPAAIGYVAEALLRGSGA